MRFELGFFSTLKIKVTWKMKYVFNNTASLTEHLREIFSLNFLRTHIRSHSKRSMN